MILERTGCDDDADGLRLDLFQLVLYDGTGLFVDLAACSKQVDALQCLPNELTRAML